MCDEARFCENIVREKNLQFQIRRKTGGNTSNNLKKKAHTNQCRGEMRAAYEAGSPNLISTLKQLF